MFSIGRKTLTTYCVRFGHAAVKLGLLTEEQLKEALCEQVEDDLTCRPHRLLGEICSQNGWITSDQIKKVMEVLAGEEEARKAGLS